MTKQVSKILTEQELIMRVSHCFKRERFINAQRPTYDPHINVSSGVGGSAEKGTYGTQQLRKVWKKT